MFDSTVALELAEMNASADLCRAATPDVVAGGGVSVHGVGDGVVIAASKIDVLALNRVVGLGHRTTPSDDVLVELVDTFNEIGSPRFFIPVAPFAGHEDFANRLARLGISHYNNWMRLRRGLKDLPSPPQTSLTIRRIGPREAGEFSAIVTAAFGYPPAIAPLSAQVVDRSNWCHYMAYEGETPIATGAMYIAGEAAWFGFAATDSRFRRRGAQQALVLRRLRDAKEAGCRWVSVETAEDTVTRDAPSFRNLKRLGFEVAYRRPNYLWTRGGVRLTCADLGSARARVTALALTDEATQ